MSNDMKQVKPRTERHEEEIKDMQSKVRESAIFQEDEIKTCRELIERLTNRVSNIEDYCGITRKTTD